MSASLGGVLPLLAMVSSSLIGLGRRTAMVGCCSSRSKETPSIEADVSGSFPEQGCVGVGK